MNAYAEELNRNALWNRHLHTAVWRLIRAQEAAGSPPEMQAAVDAAVALSNFQNLEDDYYPGAFLLPDLLREIQREGNVAVLHLVNGQTVRGQPAGASCSADGAVWVEVSSREQGTVSLNLQHVVQVQNGGRE